MTNPRALLQLMSMQDIEARVIPLWRQLVESCDNRGTSGRSHSSSPAGASDAIALRSFVDLMEDVLARELSKAAMDGNSGAPLAVCLRTALEDLATVIDVCGCGMITWSAFTSYLLDTAHVPSDRWTIDKELCAKYRPADSCSGRTQRPSAMHERRKEAVLLWDEDVHDFSTVLEALDPVSSAGRGDTVGQTELLAALRRPKGKRIEVHPPPQASLEDGDGPTYAMTPFLLTHDPTAETIDTTQRLVDIVGTAFIAAFTRSGRMFLLHRLTRLLEPCVAPIVLESSVSAAAYAQRQSFGRSVPGLPAFTSFLAVATASLRLHIICCRTFSIRAAHHLPEPVHALCYCSQRHVLFGGTASGCVVVWAVSEKGMCSMLGRWQCMPVHARSAVHPHAQVNGVVALCIATAPLKISDASQTPTDVSACNNVLIVGFQDGCVVQVDLALLPLLYNLRQTVRDWSKSSVAGNVDCTMEIIEEHVEDNADGTTSCSTGKRRALLFRPRMPQSATAGGRPATAGEDASEDPEASSDSIVFVGYSAALGQLISVTSGGTVTMFPKDFPSAPHSVFQDPSRRLENRIMFASLDTDGTAVVLCDYSTNLTVVSLVSLTISWKRNLHVMVVEGLAQRGRAGVLGDNPLHNTPRCFCGLSMVVEGSGGVNVLLVNTAHGCCVVLLDSASDPSSGAVFAKDGDDLLLCEPLVRNNDVLILANPHQLCLYDTVHRERVLFLTLSSSPDMVIHPAVRRSLAAHRRPIQMSALCVSLDGLRLYVGAGGTVTVARLDTGRALWRFGHDDGRRNNGVCITTIVAGGVGNLSPNAFLCLTSEMELLQFAYEPHVFDEYRVYPPVRVVSLADALKGSAVSPLPSAQVRTLARLPGLVRSYWYVSAGGRMSFARWDAKSLEWEHQWVTETIAASQGADSNVAHPLCELRHDDSVFTSTLLSPLPLMCVGTLHGELLLIVTRPHTLHGECIARWRQQNKRYQHSSATTRLGGTSTTTLPPSVAQQPSVTALVFVQPYMLYAFDASGSMTLWDISDVILHLCCGDAQVWTNHRTHTGSARRRFAHTVPRPPIIRFVGSVTTDDRGTAVHGFYCATYRQLVLVDINSRVLHRPLIMAAHVPPADDSAVLAPHLTRPSGIPRRHRSPLRTVRVVFHIVRATWRLLRCVLEMQPGSDASSMVDSFLQSTRRPGTLPGFSKPMAIIIAAPPWLDTTRHANHRTCSLDSVEDWSFTFDHEGEAASASTFCAVAATSPTWSDGTPSAQRSPSSRRRFQQVAASVLETSRRSNTSSGNHRNTQPRVVFKLRSQVGNGSEELRRHATMSSGDHEQRGGDTHHHPVRSQIDLHRQRDCFGFDPETDPSYHTMKRQVAYMSLERPTRVALALTFVSRIVRAPGEGAASTEQAPSAPQNNGGGDGCHVADARKAWVPFSALRDEVEMAVPTMSPKLCDRRVRTETPFSAPRVLTRSEVPRSLQTPPTRPSSASVVHQRSGPSPVRPQTAATRRVGFVKFPPTQTPQRDEKVRLRFV